MTLRDCLSVKDPDELTDKLNDYFSENNGQFDLDIYCKQSGYAEFLELEVTDIQRHDGSIYCKVSVSFEEVVATNCAALYANKNKSVVYSVTIDEDGEMEYEGDEQWDGVERAEDPGE